MIIRLPVNLPQNYLGYSCISVVVALKLKADKIMAEREIEGGKEVVETELPGNYSTKGIK